MHQTKQKKQIVSHPKFDENSKVKNSLLLAAAFTLPAIHCAKAETAPEHGVIGFKYLDYVDRQMSVTPDAYSGASSSNSKDRIKVKSQSLMVMMPIAGNWSVAGSYTGDSISGASPEYQDKQLTKLRDYRRAANFSVTRYLPRGSISVGVNQSNENDYISRGYSVLGRLESESKNTTFNAGISISNDDINSTNGVAKGKSKHVTDWLFGVTQVLTTEDIVQFNLGYSSGNGYFSDPYKFTDIRPNSKDHYTISTRWNHYFNQTGGTSHIGYRYYKDTFDVKAHTLSAEYFQPFGQGWSVMPLLRYYTQTAAKFYVGIDPNSTEFFNLPATQYLSLDQRLAEYGAFSWGFKVGKQIDDNWLVDFKYEQYKQKESWAIGGNGQDTLSPFSFRSIQLGLSRKF